MISRQAGVLGTSASINFKISDFGGQDCNVSVYYDSSDKGTVAANWLHFDLAIPIWVQVLTIYPSLALLMERLIISKVAAQNSAGVGWTSIDGNFTTSSTPPQPPVVTVYDANSSTFTSSGATLIGKLNSFDGSDAGYGLLRFDRSNPIRYWLGWICNRGNRAGWCRFLQSGCHGCNWGRNTTTEQKQQIMREVQSLQPQESLPHLVHPLWRLPWLM